MRRSHPARRRGFPRRYWPWSWLTGCSGHGSAGAAPVSPAAQSASPLPSGRPCGIGQTAAGVPVLVQMARGPVACPAAMTLERAYATAVASGKAPGNGGGGPVTVQRAGSARASTPRRSCAPGTPRSAQGNGAEIVAVLPSPSASPSS